MLLGAWLGSQVSCLKLDAIVSAKLGGKRFKTQTVLTIRVLFEIAVPARGCGRRLMGQHRGEHFQLLFLLRDYERRDTAIANRRIHGQTATLKASVI